MKHKYVKVLLLVLVFAAIVALCATTAFADGPSTKRDANTRYYYDKDRYILSTSY